MTANPIAKRTSSEVFETWKSLRGNGYTIEVRNPDAVTYLCMCCGSKMRIGTRMYVKLNDKGKIESAIDYYAETCQVHAAPGDVIYHEPMTAPRQATYQRQQLPSTPSTTPRYFTVDKPTPPAPPPVPTPTRSARFARTLPYCRRMTMPQRFVRKSKVQTFKQPPSSSAKELGVGTVGLNPTTVELNSTVVSPSLTIEPPQLPSGLPQSIPLPAPPQRITPASLDLIWTNTHLITSGRVEFNHHCKKSGYLRAITGREVDLPENLFESEVAAVLAQIRADQLRVLTSIERTELDLIGKFVMGHNNWACTTEEIFKRTGERTRLFTRLYSSEALTWRNELVAGIAPAKRVELNSRLAKLRFEAHSSVLAR